MSTPNYATAIAPKPYVAAADNTPIQFWFRESTRPLPGSLTIPTYPGTLNSYERAEVDRYIANPTDATLATLRLPDAIVTATAFRAMFAAPAYKAWLASVRLDKIAQQKLSVGTALEDNLAAIPASLDNTGAGGTPPTGSVIPPSPAEPNTVASVVATIATGSLGGSITLNLACATGGSTIHYRKNGGSWTNYVAPVAMNSGDTLEFYASAPGLADSDTDSFLNA